MSDLESLIATSISTPQAAIAYAPTTATQGMITMFGLKLRSGNRTSIQPIKPTELLAEMSHDESPILIDVRTPDEYGRDGHISGARLLPLQVISERVNELPMDKPIVFICRSGMRSRVACDHLARLGHTQIMNLSGGMIAWQRAGLPTVHT